MSDLTLYADAGWESPWVFHVIVALEELGLAYRLEVVPLPIAPERRAELQRRAVLGKVPLLAHGDLWLTESSAITEYLAETFPSPPILPTSTVQRARARQVMSFLRTSLGGLREDRPTSSVFSRPVTTPLSEKGQKDAAELVRVADQLITAGQGTLFDAWSVADADLALALMRLVANDDPVPRKITDYALGQWRRSSVRRYLAHSPTR
jgi:glutathione S-transferase